MVAYLSSAVSWLPPAAGKERTTVGAPCPGTGWPAATAAKILLRCSWVLGAASNLLLSSCKPATSVSRAVNSSAVISALDTEIGAGSVVMANAVVNPSAHIGTHCIINTAAVVEHDNRIGDFSHISVGARLGGAVSIGAHTWIGIGAAVGNNVSICDHCIIGAGGAVIHAITESGTYVGVPARKIK